MLLLTCWVLVTIIAALPASGQEQSGVPSPRWGAFFSSRDQRVALEPTAWPWRAIGRVNVIEGVGRRYCTGTLVGPRLVLTAAHCLFDRRLGHWVKPDAVHFVMGQARDIFAGHAKGEDIILSPGLAKTGSTAPTNERMSSEVVPGDWALIRLETTLPAAPVPVKALDGEALAQAVAHAHITRAGYGADRKYLLSVHRGCAASMSEAVPGLLLNQCDSLPGDSGSPILLLQGDEAYVIGLSSGVAYSRQSDGSFVARQGMGPAAISFAAAVAGAVEP